MRALLVKACLNGTRTRAEHPAVPLTPAELATAARAAVDAGAGALHFHPHGADGTQSLDAADCDPAVAAVREACPGIPLGLSTGAFIEPDPARRAALVAGWRGRPDFASVNVGEPGAFELFGTLAELGIGVEAGLTSMQDALALIDSGLAPACLRVLIEVPGDDPDAAVEQAAAIDAELERGGVQAPRLHHGEGPATWAVIGAAIARGRDVRVGLEDVLTLPDGTSAADNAELVAAAVAMISSG